MKSVKLSTYSQNLPSSVRERYVDKLKSIEVINCPYVLEQCNYLSSEKLASIVPNIEYPDIFIYLTQRRSAYTFEAFKSFKSLEAYKWANKGWVHSLSGFNITRDKVLLKGEVFHSQSLSKSRLQPWACVETGGTVVCAHCTCTAGMGECCSHVGALLFSAANLNAAKSSVAVTSQSCSWLNPNKNNKPVLYRAVGENPNKQLKRKHDDPWRPSKKRLQEFHFNISLLSGPGSAILKVMPKHARMFTPFEATVDTGLPLTDLFDPNLLGSKRSDLEAACEAIMDHLRVTQDNASAIEALTRRQSQSKTWMKFRSGRVTASVFKDVLNASIDSPPISLIKKICYPLAFQFSTKATRWGIANEEKAIRMFLEIYKKDHTEATLQPSGLCVSTTHPFLAASPDGLLKCQCHGTSIIEVKCPYMYRENTIEQAVESDKNFIFFKQQDGSLTINTTHKYYYQIQLQLYLCNLERGFMVVYTQRETKHVEVSLDRKFVTDNISHARAFFQKAILPELVAEWFTKPNNCKGSQEEIELNVTLRDNITLSEREQSASSNMSISNVDTTRKPLTTSTTPLSSQM